MAVTLEDIPGDRPARPAWLVGELPAKHAEIAKRIAALEDEARQYEDVAAVLWQSGRPLKAAVRALFAALGFESVLRDDGASHDVLVTLDGNRRLLVEVVSDRPGLTKKSPQIAQVVRALQEDAGDQDRVVVVSNAHPDLAPASRRDEPVAPEALRIIQGLGANVVSSATLYGIWKYSTEDPNGAKDSILKLHAQDGGHFR